MECAEFRAALIGGRARGSAGDSPELAAHVASCQACAHSLVALAAALPDAEPGGAADAQAAQALLSSVERTLARERGPLAWLRSRPSSWRVATSLAAGLVLVAAVLARAPRADLDAYPLWRLALCAAIYGCALIALVRRALAPMHRLSPPGRDRWLLGLGLGLPFALAALPPAALSHEVSTAGQGHDCLSLGALLGLAFMSALSAFDHDVQASARARVPWLVWAAGSLIANVALLFHCPIARPRHMWIVHASLVPIALLLALWAWSALRSRLTRRVA